MKPHLPYDKQLARMAERGLSYTDRSRAMAALRGIGYYRLSAYTYPFRRPGDRTDLEAGRQRNENFQEGAKLEDALHLYAFDEKLRTALLRALQTIEVGLSGKIGYVLGKRAADAHLHPGHLDEAVCNVTNSDGVTAHQKWVSRYEKLRSDAKQEEYVKHHVLHYAGEIPIWVATGFLDFGCLVRLYQLMKKQDRQKIAHELGLEGDASEVLYRWLKALNILRNHCAHNNRVWNRSTVDVPPKFSTRVVPERLHHLNALGNDDRQKLYLLVALTAYLVVAFDPRSTWPSGTFMSVAKGFGNVQGMTLENNLGFPAGWSEFSLWKQAAG